MVRGIRTRGKLVAALVAPAALIAGYLFVAPAAHSQPAFDVPCKDPRGCPDLVLNQKKLEKTKLETTTFPAEDCSVQEGQVGGTGPRRLLIFPYSTPNLGPGSLIIGDPLASENSNLFEWGACHGHYHYQKYAAYRLWTPADYARFQQLKAQNPNTLSGDIISSNGLNPVVGTKRGFCVIDTDKAKEFEGQRDDKTYTECGYGTTIHGNQGISVGWADTYGRKLPGQWIDVTNVPAGDYILDVETNPERSFQEARYDNNSASKPVTVTH
ncbi:MAG: lysyl oxidase family protein [Pseudonocardiaceae bacterium]